MSILNNNSALVIYDDAAASNNPFERFVDWRRNALNVTVSNPLTDKTTIAPSSSETIFSGVRTTGIGGSTVFALTLNPTSSTTYRMTNTSGTAAAFRTDRALTLSGSTVTVVINNNATATFTLSSGAYTGVVVGDVVFIPTVLTGDTAGPFNVLNGGFWSVLAASSTVLTLCRLAGVSFEGVAEVVLLTTNNQLKAFSSSGVQVGDTMEISAGFSSVTQKAFIVSVVTASWVEFVSTEALPLESSIQPTASGMVFYSSAKRFVRIETDQEIVVRFNGDALNNVRVSVRTPATKAGFGWLDIWGTFWSLDIVNRSKSASANVVVISAE